MNPASKTAIVLIIALLVGLLIGVGFDTWVPNDAGNALAQRDGKQGNLILHGEFELPPYEVAVNEGRIEINGTPIASSEPAAAADLPALSRDQIAFHAAVEEFYREYHELLDSGEAKAVALDAACASAESADGVVLAEVRDDRVYMEPTEGTGIFLLVGSRRVKATQEDLDKARDLRTDILATQFQRWLDRGHILIVHNEALYHVIDPEREPGALEQIRATVLLGDLSRDDRVSSLRRRMHPAIAEELVDNLYSD